ncbi:hypothetical protein FZEAL_5757 [Fusarium zealandicum]|uniref:Uncharacterized protein n=1 Tax=Fusarium zealandicum TaxID=1053134 RepID=A0A8H4UJ57_9HYPO|nr:hypothetical protein FZEAL_5757 [Fusarium zealandicum]
MAHKRQARYGRPPTHKLPGIDSLYIRDIWQDYDEEDEVEYSLEPQTSSLQHIYIDRPQHFSEDFCKDFCNTVKSVLSMTIRGEPNMGPQIYDIDDLIYAVAESHPDTLQNQTIYNPDGLKGYRCDLYHPDQLDGASVIKQLSVVVRDVELDAEFSLHGREATSQHFVEWLVNEPILPESIQVLTMWGETGMFCQTNEGLEKTELLDAGIAAMIRSKDHFKNLKAVYLDNVESSTKTQHKKRCFQNAILQGARRVSMSIP